jgi:hypothetical protein
MTRKRSQRQLQIGLIAGIALALVVTTIAAVTL